MTVGDIIKQVTEICKRNHVEHLSLFGSYAKGTETKYGDLAWKVMKDIITEYHGHWTILRARRGIL